MDPKSELLLASLLNCSAQGSNVVGCRQLRLRIMKQEVSSIIRDEDPHAGLP